MRAAAFAGGGAVEDERPRALNQVSIAHSGPATNAPLTPSALPAVLIRITLFGSRPASSSIPLPARAANTDGMRFVGDQRARRWRGRVRHSFRAAQHRQIHAEERLGDDERLFLGRVFRDQRGSSDAMSECGKTT